MDFTKILTSYKEMIETPWWQYQILGNTVGDFIGTALAFIISLFVFKFLQIFILNQLDRLAKKTKNDIDDTLVKIIKSLRPPFYLFIAFYFSAKLLYLGVSLEKTLDSLLIIWIVYQIIIASQILIEYVFTKTFKDEEDTGAKGAFSIIKSSVKIFVWVAGALIVLSNIGINVSSIIAGFGIGGIAIAFAFQNILEDLFSSFAIYLDKPFKVGDFIVVGDHKGVVRKIGIKSTRLKSLGGEEVVISNKELTTARLQNFEKMKERRIDFSFGVTYETSSEKLRSIPEKIKNIIDSVEKTRFSRCHFLQFDDFALTFKVVYFVIESEFSVYCDAQQDINFQIKELFERDGIDMAYPTQTLYIKKNI